MEEHGAVQARPRGDTSSIIRSIQDTKIENASIIQMIQPLLMRSPCATPPHPKSSTRLESRPCVDIWVTMGGVETNVPVSREGIDLAGNVLRAGIMAYSKTMLVQTNEYKVTMRLYEGVFKLQLHRVEDIFTRDESLEEAAALVTVSHTFHQFDSIIQETIPFTAVNSAGHVQVTGMRAVAQELLRYNTIATPIQSGGSSKALYNHAGMHPSDIMGVFQQMSLVTDDCDIATAINKGFGGKPVVQYAGSDALVGIHTPEANLGGTTSMQTVPADTNSNDHSIKFEVCHSSALSYSIAHKNYGNISHTLTSRFFLDFQEISNALYSGVSFCHALAYLQPPIVLNDTTSVHLINGLDFPLKNINTLQSIIESATTKMSFATHPVPWTVVNHAFYVNRFDGCKSNRMQIECYIADSGVIFFRHKKQDTFSNEVNLFIGAAYMAPKLFANSCQVDETCPRSANTSDALLEKVVHLSYPHPTSREELMRNAAEILFHINAICIHNDLCCLGTHGTHRDKIAEDNKKYHTMLRTVWVHTNLRKAADMCGGIQNCQFYTILAQLKNLSINSSANEWVSLPYL
ncbi:hypothetical protein T484DRAFT_1756654 [Baffinella frigidus]|nr:hypothetical protein T484DRAFT_1756654 [Cryptophyta sp. CCMP2293]